MIFEGLDGTNNTLSADMLARRYRLIIDNEYYLFVLLYLISNNKILNALSKPETTPQVTKCKIRILIRTLLNFKSWKENK